MAKILIIEDDPVMLRMYEKVFTFEGFEVEIGDDGAKGLQMAQAGKPDMILLDIMMPVMSGMQVLDALKADQATMDIPVIVFTNLAGKQDADTVLAKGAIQCVHKSQVNPKQVAQMVKDELGKRGVVVQGPEQGVMVEGGQSQQAGAGQQPAADATKVE